MAAEIELTNYSKGSGCGCKIIPEHLHEILKGHTVSNDKNLLVGNASADDAAVLAISSDLALISTVDFFTPIVNDAYDFGRIAATNALSDVYAMGGKPALATAILVWPTDTLPLEMASEVIRGAKEICDQLKVSLAGGHSVKGQEPMFGLSVNGFVKQLSIKRNNTVQLRDKLYLTKPLGLGILSSAHKRKLLSSEQYNEMLDAMLTPNIVGEQLGECSFVHAITDVTGFGLLGHLLEMLGEKEMTAFLEYEKIPRLSSSDLFMEQFVYPDNTTNNYKDVKDRVQFLGGAEFLLLCDPQTSGGLLVSVDEKHEHEFESLMIKSKTSFWQIGNIDQKNTAYQVIIQ
jgi:selenide, water dikinase